MGAYHRGCKVLTCEWFLHELSAVHLATTTVEQSGDTAVIHVHGDLVAAASRRFFAELRILSRRREVKRIVLDFTDVGRLDSSGIAVVSLMRRHLARGHKALELEGLTEQQRDAIQMMPPRAPTPAPVIERPGPLEQIGGRWVSAGHHVRALLSLISETLRQTGAVVLRTRQMPAGELLHQIATMGVNAIFIVGLLSFLLGMTFAYQGAVQLRQLGASVFVADLIGLVMVREVAPLMTAVILTGRTGAAIAAELGTMRVRSEIDALSTMGINPVRFLVVPRLVSLTFVVPALTLIAIAIGILGGMAVAAYSLDIPPITFWQRLVEAVGSEDFVHGLSKSFVFAWIIGFSASHLGLRAPADARGVGTATTRTVVASVFFIIITDALWATVSTFREYQ